jgi:hypothetical protein
MKFSLCLLIASAFAPYCFADDYVNGYTRSDGTYVEGHYRSKADGNSYNNYSSEGNTNPYTGTNGTKSNSNYGGYRRNR